MTLIRNVKAFVSTKNEPLKKTRAMIHFTSDNLGETLSVKAGGVMITMRYYDIERMVERERDQHYTDGHLIIDETDEFPQWIPVIDEEPELTRGDESPYSEDVIFTAVNKEEDDVVVDIGFRTEEGKWFSHSISRIIPDEWTVTAWMPLPKPYEEKEDDRDREDTETRDHQTRN